MYEDYYRFSAKPFQLNPDPRFFFGSKGHKRAMAYLDYGLSLGEGFIVITGEVGAGKTTLVRNLFRQLEVKQSAGRATGLHPTRCRGHAAQRGGFVWTGARRADQIRAAEKSSKTFSSPPPARASGFCWWWTRRKT